MSTKTSIKRIAAVAAVALTLGGFSAVSANAAPSFNNTTMYDTTNGYQLLGGNATVTLTPDVSATTVVAVSGVGSVVSATAATGSTVTGSASAGYQVVAGPSAGAVTFVLSSAVAGTQTLTATPLNANGTLGTAVTKSITWVATGSASVASLTPSIASGSAASTTDATSTIYISKSLLSTPAAQAALEVIAKDGNGNTVSGATVSFTIAGPGLISAVSGTTTTAGTARATSTTTATGGIATVFVSSDGTAGTGTITATSNGVSVTRSVVFVGAATSYTVSAAKTIYKVGSNVTTLGSTDYALKITALDSNGNPANDASATLTSGTTATATIASSVSFTSGVGYVDLTGVALGTTVITVANASSSPTVTATYTATVGSGTVTKVTTTLDAASYNAGTPAVYTVTATDASGNPVADGTYTLFSSVVASVVFGGVSLPSTTVALVAGKKSYAIYAPLVAGPVTIKATTSTDASLATAIQAGSYQVDAVIGGVADAAAQAAVDAANEATDAANAATDAANNAMDSADAAQQAALDAGDKADAALAAVTDLATKVSAIATQIASLSALVKKIAAKVKA
jgi:hypothetical protein